MQAETKFLLFSVKFIEYSFAAMIKIPMIKISFLLLSICNKPCSQRVGYSQRWGSLTIVPAGNKAKCFSSNNHTTKSIHHHHHHHHHHHRWTPLYSKYYYNVFTKPTTIYNKNSHSHQIQYHSQNIYTDQDHHL